VDPDHRLVAAEWEPQWEQALRALKAGHETARVQALEPRAELCVARAPTLRSALAQVGQRLPAIWDTGVLSRAQKQALLCGLIDNVVIHRPVPDRIHTRIVWRGGDTTSFDIPIAVGALQRLTCAPQLGDQVLAGHAAGKCDAEIAQRLTEQG
jgi:hypothetical protein